MVERCLSHRDNKSGNEELLHEHLSLVARRTKEYASYFGAAEEGYLAGLFHDLGKYGKLFQKRIRGEEEGVDHWSSGAWEVLNQYRQNGIAMALSIQGHHIGLQIGDRDSLANLNPQKLSINHPMQMKLSEATINALIADGLTCNQELSSSLYKWGMNNLSSMLDIRMLFSALVDADFVETEAWFQRDESGNRIYRKDGLLLEPEKSLQLLISYIEKISAKKKSSTKVRDMRQKLLADCLSAAEKPKGLFTLTAPTGSGKTLSMLAFALRHAIINNMRRIVVVIPYLSIIEQTVKVYREVFEQYFQGSNLGNYLLEHHSLSGIKKGNTDKEDFEDYDRRQLIQNWDAPVIITTSVQLLESLFSNQSFPCRKLHRLAGSIILFDEVQTIPVSLAVPTLAALSRLAERYNSTVVFSTATQPAYSHLDRIVRKQCAFGWQPKEIVSSKTDLFSLSRRNHVEWPEPSSSISWVQLAERLAEHKQALCIVNLKSHAKTLLSYLKNAGLENVFHLSTNMCPAHRTNVLQQVKELLKKGISCFLVSTQCIEAGVDIDFPVVYRAMGPLDAVAQAAGRCNRSGNLDSGRVIVFNPETEEGKRLYPDGTYTQATSTTSALLTKVGIDAMDINNPTLFQTYYQSLYTFANLGELKEKFANAIKQQNFIEVAQQYRLIDRDTINVLVSYDTEKFKELHEEALNIGISRQWIQSARPYSVSLFRPKCADDPLWQSLEPVKLRFNKTKDSDDWYVYIKEADYDKDIGLNPSLSPNCIIA